MDGLFLGGRFAPAGVTISFLRALYEAVVRTLIDWREDLGADLETVTGDLTDATALLDPFEAPWTTELLLDCGEWTAYLNNAIDGGDPTAAAPYLSGAMNIDLFVAIHSPRYGPGHASTQLWVIGPNGTPPLMYRRTIAADAVDGRWSWRTSGEPLPFEDKDRYSARRVRDRFDRSLLTAYLQSQGIRVDDADFYGQALRVHQRVSYPTRRETADQVCARFGW